MYCVMACLYSRVTTGCRFPQFYAYVMTLKPLGV
uniref:Uncharacterized protein n=1 Tax=Anguilla anguilla TaxID=7936 RepID=A0A0E9UWD6_ANGAN